MAKKEEIKITALYERLSRDDEQAGIELHPESENVLEEYARQKGYAILGTFLTMGTRHELQSSGFTALLEEIEAGRVETLVVKTYPVLVVIICKSVIILKLCSRKSTLHCYQQQR